MPRIFSSAAVASLLLAASFHVAAHSREPYIDPGALGQQAHAKAAEGQIVVSRTQTTMVYETYHRTEKRTKVVEVDGEKRNVEYEATVPVTVCKPVASTIEHKVAVESAQAFDMQGKQVEAPQLAAALAEGQTILLATRKVPRYYLTIYKPDTLLLVVAPHDLYGAPVVGPPPLPAPVPAEGLKPEAPRILPAPAAPAPAAAPARPAPPRAAPAPAAPVAPGVATKGPAIEPQVSMARLVDDKIGLRRYVKDVTTQTAMRTIEQDGVKKLTPFSIEIGSISDVERKYPQSVVKIQRADGKTLADGEQARLLASERCVLVSGDGQAIDERYLKIVKAEALVVIVPMTPGLSQPIIAPLPLPMPAPLPLDP